MDFEDGEWPDLAEFALRLAGNVSDVGQREVGTYIIYSLLETNPISFGEDVSGLLKLFGQTINDAQSADVCINTMMSIGAILQMIDPEDENNDVDLLKGLLPSMVRVLQLAIENGDEEKIGQSFEVFQQFLAYESALLGDYLQGLVEFMIGLAVDKKLDEDVRGQALAFLAQTVRYRRMKVQAMKVQKGTQVNTMGEELTVASMQILTELDDDEDEDDMTPARAALALLDHLSSELPPRQIIVPLLSQLPQYTAHHKPEFRKAGILALGTVVEGAPDFVASQVKAIMPQVISLLNDADVGVRHAALVGLSRLADDIAEELAEYNEQVMTALVRNLQAAMAGIKDPSQAKKNAEVIRSVCGALDSMSEGLDAEFMKQYAHELVELIGTLVTYDNYQVKIAASGALGAIAESLGEDFKPYFDDTVVALGRYLTIKDSEEDLALRSGVCDSMGRIAAAVGAQAFQPYVLDIMTSSEEALHLDNSRLRESSFILWSSLAKVYEKDFAHFLPGVFAGLFSTLELDEAGVALQLTEEEKAIAGTTDDSITAGKKIKKADEEEDGMEDGDDEDDWEDYGISAEALEKEVAVEIMGDIITHACGPEEIKNYLEKTVELIAPMIEHSYEGCRKAAVATLWRAYARVWQLMEEETGSSWEPGLPLKQTPTATLTKLGEIVSQGTMQVWDEESDRYVFFLLFAPFRFHDEPFALNPAHSDALTADAEKAPYLHSDLNHIPPLVCLHMLSQHVANSYQCCRHRDQPQCRRHSQGMRPCYPCSRRLHDEGGQHPQRAHHPLSPLPARSW